MSHRKNIQDFKVKNHLIINSYFLFCFVNSQASNKVSSSNSKLPEISLLFDFSSSYKNDCVAPKDVQWLVRIFEICLFRSVFCQM